MKEDQNWKAAKNVVKSNVRGGDIGYYTDGEMAVDIKHFMFRLARYKYVAKLMQFEKQVNVLELGCNEAWGALMLQQNIDLSSYLGVDFDDDTIEWNKKNLPSDFSFVCDDFFSYAKQINRKYDLVFALDVIEHIPREKEGEFCGLFAKTLSERGTAIIGTPHINMMPYASETSKAGHINMYDQKRLFQVCKEYFHNVYIFNMNDEIVHTGMNAMACYFFAVCSNPIAR